MTFDLGLREVIFIGFGLLFLLEEILYRFLGTYPYRRGILVKTLDVPASDDLISHGTRKKSKLTMKINDGRNEIYVRYRYPVYMEGPLLFVGQIQRDDGNTLKIRIGPLCAMFLLYLVILPLFQDGLYRAINSIALIGIVAWFYTRFLRSCRHVLKMKDRREPSGSHLNGLLPK